MEQKRFFLFLTLSLAIWVGWFSFGPKVFPGLFPKPVPKQPADVGDNAGDQNPKADDLGDEPKVDDADVKKADRTDKKTEVAAPDNDDAKPPERPAEKPPAKLAANPKREIKLGCPDPESGYFIEAVATSEGAAIATVRLNDPRYRVLDKRDEQLQVITTALDADGERHATFLTSFPELDDQFGAAKSTLRDYVWKVAAVEQDPDYPKINTSVTFTATSPDGKFQLSKRYDVHRASKQTQLDAQPRDTDSSGYQIKVQISIKNLSDEEKEFTYVAEGPVGLPLENVENARKFRDIKIGMWDDPNDMAGGITIESMTSADIAEAVAEGELKEEWKQDANDGSGEIHPFQCLGVDVQYFAAFFIPEGNQLESPNIDVIRPQLVTNIQAHPERSDVSLEIHSTRIVVPAGDEETHAYSLFVGPKRTALLAPIGADGLMDFGWFGFVSKAMLGVLKFFHGIGLPYGLAIIMLTVLVRGCMFPISRKQAASAKKMKELQPKIAELKKKYENDKEKIARAQMELFSKNNYNPLSGCLPMFLQLPIFIGLYQALYNAVDLRMAPFLWISNLAAPDALFPLPFVLPFLGSQFNLLPILTVFLFLAQQKMFMPPATDDQTRMQQKMMTYMMIFMGFMFYSMPAGLCVYFIASSLWGMGERKLLDYVKTPEPPPPDDKQPAEKKSSFWSRMSERIEAATEMQQQAAKAKSNGRSKPNKKNKKSRSRR